MTKSLDSFYSIMMVKYRRHYRDVIPRRYEPRISKKKNSATQMCLGILAMHQMDTVGYVEIYIIVHFTLIDLRKESMLHLEPL